MKNITYINAGAGSGKTYTLTNILVEKLSEIDNEGNTTINPSGVILTTFTELAAAEFREKARQQLLMGNAQKGIDSNTEAAIQLDGATIGTVHSVALHFIKKFWYLLEYGADIKTISERDADFYMSQSLARIENDPAYKADKDNFNKFRDFFDVCDKNGHPDHLFWRNYLKNIAEKIEYYNVRDLEESIDKSIETLKQVYNGPKFDNDLRDSLLAYLKKYHKYCESQTTNVAKEHAEKIAPLLNETDDIRDFLPLVSIMKKPVGGNTKIENNCPGYDHFITQLSKLSVSSSLIDILEPFVRSVFRMAEAWHKDYVAYKERNHIISYNDMEHLFLRLLETETEVQEYVHDNFRLVMVDEFQDSNPVQLKIFNRLSELIAPEGESYWVGDPKQAIYGFRGADTELINSVARNFAFYDDAEFHHGTDERHLGTGRLVESWRSRDTLVYLVNDCFQKAFAEQDGLDTKCITLTPHFKNEGLESDALVHWNFDTADTQLSDAIALKVKELLSKGIMVHNGRRDEPLSPISPRSIAILCRNNITCKTIIKSLRKYGVPVSEVEDTIIQRVEIQLIVTLLQFVQNSANKHTIADLMRLLWGNSTEEILQSRIDYINQKEENGEDEWMIEDCKVQELKQLALRIKHLSVPEIVETLVYECDVLSIAERWGEAHTRRQNLSMLQHLAKDYDQMCLQFGLGTSINGFINYLYTIEPDKVKDNMSDTVKVLTYHGSKGLEWPIVIMNDLDEDILKDDEYAKKQFANVQEVVCEDTSTPDNPFDKTYYLHLFPRALKTDKNKFSEDVLENIKCLPLYQQMQKRSKGEERRLLYVGMTRAKDCIYTIGKKKNSNAWLKNAGIEGVTEDNIWGVDKYKPSQDVSIPDVPNEKKARSQYILQRKPNIHSEHRMQHLSPSSISEYHGYDSHSTFGKRGNDIPTKGWNKADYATIGTCIHDFFAVFIPGDEEGNKRKAASVIDGYGLTNIIGEHIDAIIASAEHLYAQLNAKFPHKHTEREFPFSVHIDTGQILRGEIDLLWFYENADGEHCILVDYKSYAGYDMDEHTKTYYAQLSAYTDALQKTGVDVTHAIVYYPVHTIMHQLVVL